MSNNKTFWQTKEGKILSHGIHEHSSGLGYIVNSVNFIEILLEKNLLELNFKDEQTKEKFFKCLDLIKKGKLKCKESIDYIYSEIKKLKENE